MFRPSLFIFRPPPAREPMTAVAAVALALVAPAAGYTITVYVSFRTAQLASSDPFQQEQLPIHCLASHAAARCRPGHPRADGLGGTIGKQHDRLLARRLGRRRVGPHRVRL